jgi:hypothetical protein
VSTYALAADSGTVLVIWPTGRAQQATPVTTLPDGEPFAREDLVVALDNLCEVLWATYTHPAVQEGGDPDEAHTEAWHWSRERGAFPTALAAVRAPDLTPGINLEARYPPVVEGGHQVGRALHRLAADEALIDVIVREVEQEQAAIEGAESGDLTGRAEQAVALSRVTASPTQVAMAWQALLADPLGSHDELLTRFEPSSAAVAAAEALQCAAIITAGVSGVPWADVVIESNDIEPLPMVSPTDVLIRMDLGFTARQAVTELLDAAQGIAEGYLPDLHQLESTIRVVAKSADAQLGEGDRRLRLTPLDPRRPARHLLEDLLTGIHGCRALWCRYIDRPGSAGGAGAGGRPESRNERFHDAMVAAMALRPGPF